MAVAEPTSPRERAGKIVDDLAKRGEVRAKEIQKAAREISEKSGRDRRDLIRLVQKEIKRQIEGLGLPGRSEIERLTKRLEKLEKKDN